MKSKIYPVSCQSLIVLVDDSYPEQHWMVMELFQAFTDPTFNHAERLKLFEQQYVKLAGGAPFEQSSNGVNKFTILTAFRDFDRALALRVPVVSFTGLSNIEGVSKAQIRKKAISIGLPEFWREQGFPPQCRPVGDDDFECD